MPNTRSVNSVSNNRVAFFQEFLKHPLQIGSIIPSSRYLEQRILEAAEVASANTIIELGSGTGGTTRAILHAMPEDARLLSIDINPRFHEMVKHIQDTRLITHLGSACDLQDIMHQHGLAAPQAIISGIPFSTMDNHIGTRICASIASILAPGGRFVAYQVSPRVAMLCRPFLGTENVGLEIFNIPPMRVYQWQKRMP